ncbi:DUF1203 domain-containing protein [Sphingomonas sp. H39-1-10]|uniref:DUF1203 domain-containing protein n=1 Tax=Sphingomonas TaxID=13687 RepID=UPI000884FA6D|nr:MULTISPECIES: DUF1203 domain-containing protein [Sphingomonas]MDF0489068.1 DUF1203 domain-containing protein [Sphingomonas pollutisoli]SDA20696.1 Protein of unknown function [Sphingomonas sp. NFR15]
MSGFVIQGLDPAPFRELYGLSDAALADRGVVRMRVDAHPGFPCRVTLEDVAPSADVLLLNFEHLPVATPYRARHAIFVREGADAPARYEDAVPDVLARRLLSLRAFDAAGMMTDADVIDGADLAPAIARMFADPTVAYLHAHNAKRGCFAARIDRG